MGKGVHYIKIGTLNTEFWLKNIAQSTIAFDCQIYISHMITKQLFHYIMKQNGTMRLYSHYEMPKRKYLLVTTIQVPYAVELDYSE